MKNPHYHAILIVSIKNKKEKSEHSKKRDKRSSLKHTLYVHTVREDGESGLKKEKKFCYFLLSFFQRYFLSPQRANFTKAHGPGNIHNFSYNIDIGEFHSSITTRDLRYLLCQCTFDS